MVTLSIAGLELEDGGLKCVFGSATTWARLLNDSAVACTVPSAAVAGSVTFGLSGVTGDMIYRDEYLLYDHPTIQSILPSYGALGKTSLVTLVGTGFTGDGLECRFGSEVVRGAGVRRLTTSMVMCESPQSKVAESVALEVSLNGGADFTSLRKEFTFQQSPTLEGLLPSAGASGAGGYDVTVTGRHFDGGSDLTCNFGRSPPVRAIYLTSSSISCKMGPIRAGRVSVGVTQHGVAAVGEGVQFIVNPAHDAWTLYPSHGPTSGGNMVTIVGSLTSGVGVSGGCLFGSLNVPGEVVNASSIRCVVPAGKAGRVVSVQVKNAVSDPDSGTGRPYRYHAQVRMNAAWPTRGSIESAPSRAGLPACPSRTARARCTR